VRRMEHGDVVVAARNLNPSILSPVWLVKNGIVTEDAPQGEWVIAPPLVQVPAPEFVIVAVPDHIQFAPRKPDSDVQNLVSAKLGAIVRLLPHTPYTAVGLNFHWSATTTDLDQYGAAQRAALVRSGSPIYDQFPSADARFGAYASADALGFRIKLTVLPINGMREGLRFEGLLYQFNFHRDLLVPDRAPGEIEEAIGLWTEARELSRAILDRSTEWIGDVH